MEERKFIRLNKEEFGIKEYIKRDLGKGKISKLDIEYTPVGEKIIISTSKPGLVIGRKGEKIGELTDVLKRRFKLENPHIEIKEIENPLFDSQNVADEIALALERMGNLKFKVIAYRKLQEIMRAGALGCEMRLTGKLPSERAKSWRFAEGYLKKAGESSKEIDRAQATALTKTGIIGIKVAIMPPGARIYDRIDINAEMMSKVKLNRDMKDQDKDKKSNKKPTKDNKKEIKIKPVKKEKTIEYSREILHDKLEAVEEEHDEIAGHNIIKSKDKSKVIKETKPGKEIGEAMKIEEEIEEGVSEDDDDTIDKIENEEKKKYNKESNLKENKK